MIRSGYVLAGFETLANIMNNFINNTKNCYFDNFTREDISKFLFNTCSGFLHSYGQNFPGKKSYKNYNKNEANLYKKCRDTKLFEGSKFTTDSGGSAHSECSLSKEIERLTNIIKKKVEVVKRWTTESQKLANEAHILRVDKNGLKDTLNATREIFNTTEQLLKDVKFKYAELFGKIEVMTKNLKILSDKDEKSVALKNLHISH